MKVGQNLVKLIVQCRLRRMGPRSTSRLELWRWWIGRRRITSPGRRRYRSTSDWWGQRWRCESSLCDRHIRTSVLSRFVFAALPWRL